MATRSLHSPYAHATISAVRTLLGIAVRYILWLAALFVITALVVVAHAYVTGYDPLRATTPETLLELLTHGTAQVLLGCSLVAAAVSLFSILKRVSRPVIPLVVVGGLTALALVVTGLFDSDARNPATARAMPIQTVVRIGNVRVYALEGHGISYGPLVSHNIGIIPGFRVHTEGVVDLETGELLIPSSAAALSLTDSEDSYPALVRPPGLVSHTLSDLDIVTRAVSLEGDGSAPLTIAALALLVVSLWTFVRLTRWPLFNAVLTIATLRGALRTAEPDSYLQHTESDR